ncbi:MAG: hypothetical protein KC729_02025, partial [Candidatus Eisenbacteria bacterium]|nr:hypothetical protein [Candidatus Eisenbacteria bacterium]
MSPLEAWEKVLISGDAGAQFLASIHGQMACVTCHGGDDETADKDQAHTGMNARPSAQVSGVCIQCHAEVAHLPNSLHGGLWGEKALVAARYGAASFDALPASVHDGYGRDCAGCHSTCGDCHISRPQSVGGGFIASHKFGSPDMTNQCTACHGSRIGMEYRGENEGFSADVHFVPGAMRCQSCHDADEMHGDGTRYSHRLSVPNAAACDDCHAGASGENEYHEAHWGDLQCQVCHSQDYKSCNTCHAGEGLASPSYMDFKIGRNPVPGKRPFDYVLLRHIPIAPDTYSDWGVGALADYSSEPTWKYAAPHNIRRWTDRTEVPAGGSCFDACHGTSDGADGLFLRQADLDAMSAE